MIGSLTRFGQPVPVRTYLYLYPEKLKGGGNQQTGCCLQPVGVNRFARIGLPLLARAANFHVIMVLSLRLGDQHLSWGWLGMAEAVRSRVFS